MCCSHCCRSLVPVLLMSCYGFHSVVTVITLSSLYCWCPVPVLFFFVYIFLAITSLTVTLPCICLVSVLFLSRFDIVFIRLLFSFAARKTFSTAIMRKIFLHQVYTNLAYATPTYRGVKNYKFPWLIKTYVGTKLVETEMGFSSGSGTTKGIWYTRNNP